MSRSLQQPAHGWMRNTRSVPTHPLGLGRKPQSGTRTAAPLRGAAVDPAVQTSPAGGGGSGGKTTNKDEKPDDNPGRNGKEQGPTWQERYGPFVLWILLALAVWGLWNVGWCLESGLHLAGIAVGVGATIVPKPGEAAGTALERGAQQLGKELAQGVEEAAKSMAQGVEAAGKSVAKGVEEAGKSVAGTATGVGATQPGEAVDTALERAAQHHGELVAQGVAAAGTSVAQGVAAAGTSVGWGLAAIAVGMIIAARQGPGSGPRAP